MLSSPSPLAGEGWDEGVSTIENPPRGESPHPALRADLSRKRERCTETDARSTSQNSRIFTSAAACRASGGADARCACWRGT
nr:hypothetical protein CIT39_25515 [Bradyrhizobium symbiodeficiens]QDF40062.1 hypothetical protein FJN17_22230 [Bradyrhizobium symbiodeficiens]